MYAYEMDAYDVYGHEVHAKMYVYETHAGSDARS